MITEFREAVNDCRLMDLGCRRYPFTWSNKRFRPHYVEERLDRFLGSEDWRSSCFDLMVSNLISWGSDHCPITLEMQDQKKFLCFKRKRKPRVHYENIWSHYEECRHIVEEEWRQWGNWYDGDHVQSFHNASNYLMARLLAWSKKEFNNRKKKLGDMKLNYQHFKEVNEFKSTEDQIERLLLDEEVY